MDTGALTTDTPLPITTDTRGPIITDTRAELTTATGPVSTDTRAVSMDTHPVSIETVCNSKRKAPRTMRGFLFTGGELSPSLANACRARERTAAMPRHRDR